MLGFAALAEVALAEIPGVFVEPVPPAPPRFNATGVVVVVDVVPDRTYGTSPVIGASFVLIINQPFLYTPVALGGTITLQFTAPSGKVQFSDDRYLNVNAQTLLQQEQFDSPQYLVYQTGQNEFNEAGVWQVIVQNNNAQSAVYFFTVGAQ